MDLPPPSRPASSRPPPRPGAWRARRLSELVFETTFEGHLTAELLAAAGAEYWRVVGDRALPYTVLDTIAATGFDRTLGIEGSLASSRFRERGGRAFLVVTTSSSLRMIGSAIGASSQVPFRFFDTRVAAFDHLRAIGAW